MSGRYWGVYATALLAVAAIGGAEGIHLWNQAEDAQAMRDVAAVLPLAGDAVAAIGAERVAALDSTTGDAASLQTATDQAVEAFQTAVTQAANSSSIVARWNSTSNSQTQALLDRARSSAMMTAGDRLTATTSYDQTVNEMLALSTQVSGQSSNRAVATLADATIELIRLTDAVATERSLLTEALTADPGTSSPATTPGLTAAMHQVEATNQLRARTNALLSERGSLAAPLPLPQQDYAQLRMLIASGPSGAGGQQVQASQWADAARGEIASLRDSQATLLTTLDREARDAATRATWWFWALVAAVAFLAILGLVVGLVLGRGDRRRKREARESLAPASGASPAPPARSDGLPVFAAVPLPSTGTTGAIATGSVDDSSTDDLARSHPDTGIGQQPAVEPIPAAPGTVPPVFGALIDLARRNLTLLTDSLDVLDDLEQRETNPDTLIGLFALDNLTMRLRRQGESLLVLAGAEPLRTAGQPLVLSDVVRMACSQIEGYDRVVVDLPTDPVLLSHYVGTTSHLVAELLDNAIRFSGPLTTVQVTARTTRAAVELLIADRGIGMPEHELASARTILASDGATFGFDRIGLHVVRRLAARLGAHVDLRQQDDGQGIVAIVTIPSARFEPLDAATMAAANMTPLPRFGETWPIGTESPGSPTPAPLEPSTAAAPSFSYDSAVPDTASATAPDTTARSTDDRADYTWPGTGGATMGTAPDQRPTVPPADTSATAPGWTPVDELIPPPPAPLPALGPLPMTATSGLDRVQPDEATLSWPMLDWATPTDSDAQASPAPTSAPSSPPPALPDDSARSREETRERPPLVFDLRPAPDDATASRPVPRVPRSAEAFSSWRQHPAGGDRTAAPAWPPVTPRDEAGQESSEASTGHRRPPARSATPIGDMLAYLSDSREALAGFGFDFEAAAMRLASDSRVYTPQTGDAGSELAIRHLRLITSEETVPDPEPELSRAPAEVRNRFAAFHAGVLRALPDPGSRH